MTKALSVSMVAAVLCAAAGPAFGAEATYAVTAYVAGHGGHFAKASVVIAPGDAANPLQVKSLEMVPIGTTETHKMHDGRIDAQDPNVLFFSTYALDPDGKLHVGKADLRTGKVIQDVAFAPDARSPAKNPPAYCASGQGKTTFLPVFMGNEGYVDVYDKKSMKLQHRVFVSDLGYKPGSYQFVHGSNSTDLKRFLLTLTLKGEDGKMNGKQDLLVLDLPALEQGKLKVLAKATLTGEPGKTIAFRQYYTADDKLIFQSAADRMWVIDAATLKIVDEKMTKPDVGENHDVQPTPDGKYALLTARSSDTVACDADGKPIADKKVTDGVLQAYDAKNKKLIGKPVSVCFGCHKEMGKGDKNAVLCGIAANFAK